MSKSIGVFLDTNQVESDARPQQHARFNIDSASISTTNPSTTASHNTSIIQAMETRARKFTVQRSQVLPQCKQFLPLEDLARCIVEEVVELAERKANDILDEAEDETYCDIYTPPSQKSSDSSSTLVKAGQSNGDQHSFDNVSYSFSSMFSLISSTDNSIFSIDSGMKWPTIGEFNIDGAMEKIEDYLLFYCLLEENWKFVVNFLGNSTDDYFNHYYYERELDEVVFEWNTHRIRRSRNARGPTGRPICMFELPENYRRTNCLIDVPEEVIHIIQRDREVISEVPFSDDDVKNLCNSILLQREYDRNMLIMREMQSIYFVH